MLAEGPGVAERPEVQGSRGSMEREDVPIASAPLRSFLFQARSTQCTGRHLASAAGSRAHHRSGVRRVLGELGRLLPGIGPAADPWAEAHVQAGRGCTRQGARRPPNAPVGGSTAGLGRGKKGLQLAGALAAAPQQLDGKHTRAVHAGARLRRSRGPVRVSGRGSASASAGGSSGSSNAAEEEAGGG